MTTRNTAIGAVASALLASIVAFFVVLLYDRASAPEIVIEHAPSRLEIAVSVQGAVNEPGVYRLDGDARLIDLIDAAGGLRADAERTSLNLAERLRDEQTVVIASTNAAVASPVSPSAVGISAGTLTVDINSADVAELDTLPGIGPVLAQRIVDFRTEHGPFGRIEELARVDGISLDMVREFEDRITAGP